MMHALQRLQSGQFAAAIGFGSASGTALPQYGSPLGPA
jgi:hypothetical protein